MKYRPSDAELLATIAELLEEEVLPAVPAAVQHKVRVAANLTRILERQQELEPAALERERSLLASLLGYAGDQRGGGASDVANLRAELDRRLSDLDPVEVWKVLVAIARDDLATAKPGYDSWAGD